MASDAEWLDPRFRRLLAVQIAYGYAFSSLLVAPKFLTAALGANPMQLGELTACPALAGVAAAPFCGRWLDRGGARSALFAGSALLTLSIGVFGSFDEVSSGLYVCRALQGVGNTLVVGGTAALVTLFVTPKNHARAFGLAGSASLAMNALAALATERIAELIGWRFAFFVGACAALIAFLLASTVPDVRPQPVRHAQTAPLPRSGRGSTVAWAALAAGGGFATLATFTQPYALSLGATHVANLFVGYTITALFVRLTLGGPIDRWGRRRAVFTALGLYAVTLLAAATLEPSWLFVLGLGFGLAHGLVWPSLNALAVEHAAPGRSGSALTHVHALFGAGSMGAVWSVGWMVGALGYARSFAIAALFIAVAAFTVRPDRTRR